MAAKRLALTCFCRLWWVRLPVQHRFRISVLVTISLNAPFLSKGTVARDRQTDGCTYVFFYFFFIFAPAISNHNSSNINTEVDSKAKHQQLPM